MPLTKALQTGIAYQPPLAGLVPEVEERDGAIFNGYTWRDWQELPYHERVFGIAHYRVHRLILLHTNEAEIKAAERARANAQARE